jgi:hypothetical protein
MGLNEYDIGSRNVHHHPLMRSTTIDVPGNSIEFIDSGNVGMHDDGFHLDPPTQFEYSQTNRNDNEETTVITKQTMDMVIEAALKMNMPFPKIKQLVELFGTGSPANCAGKGNQKKSISTNGTDKEGLRPDRNSGSVDDPQNDEQIKECNANVPDVDTEKDYTKYPKNQKPDKFKDSIIEKGLALGLAFTDIKNILEVAGSGNPSLNHNYPYESKGHVDGEAIIKTPWPQAHMGHDTEPQPGAEQEFRSPTESRNSYVKDPHDPGKGHTPQIESVKKSKVRESEYVYNINSNEEENREYWTKSYRVLLKYNLIPKEIPEEAYVEKMMELDKLLLDKVGGLGAQINKEKNKPQMESVIGKGLQMGLTYSEIKKVLEDIKSKHDTTFGAGANEDRNEEKDTDHSPEAAEDDAKKGKNTQIGEGKKKDPTKEKPYSKWVDGEDGSAKKPIKYNQETGDIKCAPSKKDKKEEKTEKVKGGYENIGKKKNGAKKHGVTTKKKADAQRGAMFAHRKPGASWGK